VRAHSAGSDTMSLLARLFAVLAPALVVAGVLMLEGQWCFAHHGPAEDDCWAGTCSAEYWDGSALDTPDHEPVCAWGGGD
jgi:hypothetical protein